MLATSKESASGAVFHSSSRNSHFYRVFKNNMVSYVGDRIIDSALSAPNTAFFESVPTLDYSEEYQSCQVFKFFAKIIFLKAYYLRFLVAKSDHTPFFCKNFCTSTRPC